MHRVRGGGSGGRGGTGGGKDGGRWRERWERWDGRWEGWCEVAGGLRLGSVGSRPALVPTCPPLRRAALQATQSHSGPPTASCSRMAPSLHRALPAWRLPAWRPPCRSGNAAVAAARWRRRPRVAVAAAVCRRRRGYALDMRMPPTRKVSVVASMVASPQFHLRIRHVQCSAVQCRQCSAEVERAARAHACICACVARARARAARPL